MGSPWERDHVLVISLYRASSIVELTTQSSSLFPFEGEPSWRDNHIHQTVIGHPDADLCGAEWMEEIKAQFRVSLTLPCRLWFILFCDCQSPSQIPFETSSELCPVHAGCCSRGRVRKRRAQTLIDAEVWVSLRPVCMWACLCTYMHTFEGWRGSILKSRISFRWAQEEIEKEVRVRRPEK